MIVALSGKEEPPQLRAVQAPSIGRMNLWPPDVLGRVGGNPAVDGGSVRPVKDQFYGDRSGTLDDPFGHVWTIATHKEDISLEEMHRRAEAFMKQSAGVS